MALQTTDTDLNQIADLLSKLTPTGLKRTLQLLEHLPPEEQPTQQNHLHLSPHSKEMQMAAFIVGALAFEEYIVLKPDDTESCQCYTNAIRMVAACLYHLRCDQGDMPILPFSW